jgi:hypothetical protein
VLERRIAVGDQRHVHPEQRAALGDHLHPLAAGGLDHLLALLAARLVVILDAVRALRLQAADMRQRIVDAVDLGIDVGRLGAIDDLAGREDARSDDLPARCSSAATKISLDRADGSKIVVVPSARFW